MKYVYPKLSHPDLFVVRLGGAGLGNLLFTYANALVYARKTGRQLIWPTWPSVKIGPILRNEKDKRFYLDLFENHSEYIGGLKKWSYLCFKSKVYEKDLKEENPEDIVVFDTFNFSFKSIEGEHAYILEDLKKNLKAKNKKALDFKCDKAICMHVRLGDFSKVTQADLEAGKNNCRLPIEWYKEMVLKIRQVVGEDLKVYVFSDGTDEELAPVLNLNHVERMSFGTSIGDILALAKAKVLIASGSSFSMWARYLGRMNTIAYTNQLKEKLLLPEESNFEIELGMADEIPVEIIERLKSVLK